MSHGSNRRQIASSTQADMDNDRNQRPPAAHSAYAAVMLFASTVSMLIGGCDKSQGKNSDIELSYIPILSHGCPKLWIYLHDPNAQSEPVLEGPPRVHRDGASFRLVYALFPNGVEIESTQGTRGGPPYRSLTSSQAQIAGTLEAARSFLRSAGGENHGISDSRSLILVAADERGFSAYEDSDLSYLTIDELRAYSIGKETRDGRGLFRETLFGLFDNRGFDSAPTYAGDVIFVGGPDFR